MSKIKFLHAFSAVITTAFFISALTLPEIASAQATSKVAPADAPRDVAKPSNRGLPTLLEQDFEENTVPPTGWSTIVTNPNFTWEANDLNPQEGNFYVSTFFNVDLVPQDEWLISPAFNLISGELDIWSLGSIFWCITEDNCDPEIWLLAGDTPNTATDTLVYNLEDDWPDTFIWTNAVIDLDPFVDGSPVRIGIRYVGNDGAEVSIDNLTLRGEEQLLVLPESQPVPVNNIWALGLMVLLLAGLGLVVIRRMF